MTDVPATLSVILCTHNPRAEPLRRVLAGLRSQTLPSGQWELLLVDNASDRPLKGEWDLSWHPRARHVREDRRGKTAALLRGIADSTGDWLVCVDDDNVLAADYLENAAAISLRYPYLGVLGSGALEPEFEIPPPTELISRLSLLAIRKVVAPLWSNNPDDHAAIPWGAGMVVRRSLAGEYQELLGRPGLREFVGPRGQELFRGRGWDDDIFSWLAAADGLGFGIFPQLRLTHLIAGARLNQGYFVEMIQSHAFSHGVLNHLLARETAHRADFFFLGRLLLHGVRNGYFSMRCQWAYERGRVTAAKFITDNHLPQYALDGRGLVRR